MFINTGAPRGYWVKSIEGKLKVWARNRREANELVAEGRRLGMTLEIKRG